jgi:hypothetical protein
MFIEIFREAYQKLINKIKYLVSSIILLVEGEKLFYSLKLSLLGKI